MLVQKSFKDKFRVGKETGCLNYTGSNLTQVLDEIYNFDNFTPEGGEWWTSVPLTKLILAQNEIK